MSLNVMRKSALPVRLLLTGLLCWAIYREAGPFTALFAFLVSVGLEIMGARLKRLLAASDALIDVVAASIAKQDLRQSAWAKQQAAGQTKLSYADWFADRLTAALDRRFRNPSRSDPI